MYLKGKLGDFVITVRNNDIAETLASSYFPTLK